MKNKHQDWVSITCPKCNASQNVFVYKIANVTEEPELRQKLFKSELNVFDCVQCKSKLHYDEYMMYVDREKGLLIHVFSNDYKDKQDDICARLVSELLGMPPEEMMPNYIIFGYGPLAQIIGLIEQPESIKNIRKYSEEIDDPALYRRLFVISQEWIHNHADKEFENNLPQAEILFNDAFALQKNKEYEKAVELYKKALSVCPDYYNANFNLGLIYHNQLNLPRDGLEYLVKCRNLRPNDHDVVFCLGQLYLKCENPAEAVKCFRNAAVISPESSIVWFNLGLGLSMINRVDDGLECLKVSLDLSGSEEDRAIVARTIERVEEKLKK